MLQLSQLVRFLSVVINTKNVIILSLLGLVLMTSCVTERACERKFGYVGYPSKEIIYLDTTIFIPGATVRDTFKLRDTILNKEYYTAYETKTIIDSTGRAQLQWYRDMYGNLVASCTATRDTVKIDKVTTVIKEVQQKEKPLTFWGRLSNTMNEVIWVLVLGCLLIIGIKVFLK